MELPTPEDLREHRNRVGLTQSALADRAEVSQPLIARIESGDVDPRLSTLRRIVTSLDAAEGGIRRARDLMHTSVIAIAPDDSVREAIDRMGEEGYSQLPVVHDGYPVGIISNGDVRRASSENAAELPVADVMRESITTVAPEATLDTVDTHLDHHDAVIVVESGQMLGIITEADVAAHLS
ncbi:CBS domain-containing protein [Halococcus thailandensis]|uniref:XRE family transcriptional regulator n=1 Tax=Halococcus thailandensis JCM 13552 TaxID=1227457 RepID=M0N0K6_9EURY|nr:CBS domain-containing protein [Halococcus thailandensis]EMA51073.1 XRE family transcriptional regulator [Halococcus thailandensis JCM 13552]